MVQLNDGQVDIVFNRIVNDGVTNHNLQNSLLDHYCCFIESELMHGDSFENAYQKAFKAISPNGMYEIQHELILVLTFKQITMMKRMIYGCGFIAIFCLSTGLMFRTAKWPGAAALSLTGFIFLIITAIILLVNFIKHSKHHTAIYNIRMLAGFIAVLLIGIGSIFKFLLFPGANMLQLSGMLVLNFLFVPMFFYHLYRQALQSRLNAPKV